ncbi:MAG: CarD family transcriptional regulator, partial [Hyphomicrobium sp.]
MPKPAVAAQSAKPVKAVAAAASTGSKKMSATPVGSPKANVAAAVMPTPRKDPVKVTPTTKAAIQPVPVAPAVAVPPVAVSADSKKPVSQRHGFKTSEYIVYPAHGVGKIVSIEEQEVAGLKLELFVITFEKDKMTLRVPTAKTQSVGMRKLAETDTVGRAMETLKGRARIKRTMWSRRAQEYEAKINSGDLIAIAEVVRDLYRSESQPEQSYSERQLYEAALDRMAREIAAVEKLDDRGAVQRITEILARSARGLRVER